MNAPSKSAAPRAAVCLGILVSSLLLAACEKPRPRSFSDFMDDRIAREGTIAHCNQNPVETANDIECANARRAATTVALRAERDRREELERESERKLEALRNEMAERERIVRESTLAAARAEREAYEKLWRGTPQDAAAVDARSADAASDVPNFVELPPRVQTNAEQ